MHKFNILNQGKVIGLDIMQEISRRYKGSLTATDF